VCGEEDWGHVVVSGAMSGNAGVVDIRFCIIWTGKLHGWRLKLYSALRGWRHL
jgi:hypothetical protein